MPTPKYSAALCRGLIEAWDGTGTYDRRCTVYSAALCRGLIEAGESVQVLVLGGLVFRGSMPRPH